ncbi:YcjF family protein [Vibrio vulnificus]|uniref:YcjF family protein n=1 Tax=Vibrio vulnificus TaxID=672 RepID=UPI001DA4CA33|nr:TIGR01620 family protein [Vibrio vulnificus]EHZ2752855.1 TIGR01620 family protein [Vibrio vulnificus]EHZ2761066.1 TIGR01620 family protein [Vibrio vulnificus]EJO3993391.1 TIGR01620 family protein [Vibrio vulnificus]EKD8801730.1 TIGR01620 family protein [Vibrio vulnificus]
MSDLKPKQVFEETIFSQQDKPELTAQQQFDQQQTFIPTTIEESEPVLGDALEQVIRPSGRRKWLAGGLFTAFAGLVGWQAVDSVLSALQNGDWLTLGWSGLISVLAGLGLGAIGKELWKLRQLRHLFSVQEQGEKLLQSDSVGQGKDFCQKVAKQSGVAEENPAYDRWKNSVNTAHSDAEILQMYDAMVVTQQDKQATQVISRFATESAALVAISPLAIADMLLVAWRNFKMIDTLSTIYGIELGYASRIRLLRLVLANMAVAGASELVIDAGMDLMSMDLAGKLSARAGQGVGVGILTARLGLKAMALLRPIPWQTETQVKLSAIRKEIVSKVASITLKP